MANWVVIMAGGSGTRFWPASRAKKPKQFLKIGGDQTLLERTAKRVLPMVPWERILVVAGVVHEEAVRESLPELPAENLLMEPTGRNTAPCIAWATEVVAQRDSDAAIAVLPADHFIGDEERFLLYLREAYDLCADNVVLFGIVPDRPATGYGYIERGSTIEKRELATLEAVARFVEKPDRPTAEGYLASGRFYWNSGMFIFRGPIMRASLQEHMPDLAAGVADLMARPDDIDTIYRTLPAQSIDYGVMERSSNVAVVGASFGWSDVGSWDAMNEVYASDDDDNVVLGEAILHGVRRSVVDARGGRLVSVVGLEDVIVVDTPDAMLVVGSGRSEDVKKIVERLRADGRKDLL